MFYWRIFTLYILINKVKGQPYCVGRYRGNASSATSLCNLATPNYTSFGDNYEINVNVASSESLWVGYTETAFSYKGCKKNTGKVGSTITVTNLAACYLMCDTSYFGIEGSKQQKRCHCIQNITNDGPRLCTHICDFPNGTLCGGGNPNFVSVYERVNYTETELTEEQVGDSGPKHCLAYEPSMMKFTWVACSSAFQSVCIANGGLINTTMRNGTWADVMHRCLKESMLPVPATANFSSIALEDGHFWTSTIRSFNKCNSSNQCRDRQGYIENKITSLNGPYTTYILKFSYSGTLPALCDEDSVSGNCTVSTTAITKLASTPNGTTTNASSTTTLFSTTVSSVSTEGSTSNQHPTNVSNKSTSSSSAGYTQTALTNISQSPENESPDAGESSRATEENRNLVGVYVAVPFILILIAAVIGIILWRQRTRRSFEKSTKNEPVINGGILNDGFAAAISNSAYEGNAAVRHDYFVLEPTNEYAAIIDTGVVQSSTDEEYDTTTAVHAKANGDLGTGNIYNRLDEATDDTYNHCDKITFVSDDAYSHIKSGKKSSDSIGIDSAGISSANDTYNHITAKTPSANTALVKPEKVQTDITEDEDTYSHTGAFDAKSPEKAFKPDSSRKPVTETTDKKLSKDVNGRPNYDYAYTTAAKGNDTKQQGMFTLNQLPNSRDYEFAKEPQDTSLGYENVNTTPIYLELSKE